MNGKLWKGLTVAAMVVGLAALLWPIVTATPEPPIARTTTTYYVTNGANYLTIAGSVYTVTNGQVALNDAAYATYKPLIDAGVLVQTLATGSGIFVNSSLARVGSGAALDVQAGATFTANTTINGNPIFAGATAIGTATPAVVVNQAGVSNIFEARKNATPQFVVNNDGSVTAAGAASVGGALSVTGGQSNSNWVKVAAPTAVGTATPAAVVDNAGAGNVLLSVRKAATPAFEVYNSGVVNGKVLRYATAGTQIVCGTQTITDTANVSHGLATPAYAMCSLNQTLTGGAYACNATVSGITVTVKVRNNAATPAANAAGASINWCVIGTP